MWYYCWPHSVYHLIRWFPKTNRLKIRIVVTIFTCALLVPQFFVLTRQQSTRYCGQQLFDLLVASIVFTFCMIGFTFLFALMDPVPREVKLAFHVFGLAAFVLGLIYTIQTATGEECRNNTPELYYLSLAFTIMAMITTAFLLVMIPFWLMNHVWDRSVLDYRERSGLCYEPVMCCSCVWHV
ncbi:uncharacterized protein LOC144924999 [Branchiostoma floridae x Branchiostoma belcheri]